MKPFTVIKHFDIFKYILFSLGSGLVALMMNQLCFQRMEEAFRNGIIPAVTFTAHALDDAMLQQECAMTVLGVLTASIGMPNQALAGLTFPNGHQ